MTRDVQTAHLSGEQEIGLYPMLDGDRCWWLAADFDGRPRCWTRWGIRRLVAAGLGAPADHALISLLAINGLRISEAGVVRSR